MSEAFDQFVDSVVTVTKGRHRGRSGYCDDVEDSEAIVYFKSWDDGYSVVPMDSLKKADATAEQEYLSEYMSSPERWYGKTPMQV